MPVRKHLILNVAGLTPKLLTSGDMPRLEAFAYLRGGPSPWTPSLPAVTASVQADLLCGGRPGSGHGIVGNGWYFRDLAEVKMWPQSARLIQQPTVFERWRAQHPGSPSAQMFWWWNLPSYADLSVTPRPTYWSDGRKGPDIHSNPPSLRQRLRQRYGEFPLFNFWGPGADITSTRWIVDATLDVLKEERPGLCLCYLPHLDYDLQRFGPDSEQASKAAAAVDAEAARLLDFAAAEDLELSVISEYGIEAVSQAVFPNRILREAGLLAIHPAHNGSILDPGNSRAFAVCDHQCAHVYVANPRDLATVTELLAASPGIETVYQPEQLESIGLNHPRSGELFCVAKPGWWLAYPYWLESDAEPDFARCVDIHKKPGYDPCELFIDPALALPKVRIGMKLLAKKLGMRTLMNFIPTDTGLVKGSHGRLPSSPELGPVFIAAEGCPLSCTFAAATPSDRKRKNVAR